MSTRKLPITELLEQSKPPQYTVKGLLREIVIGILLRVHFYVEGKAKQTWKRMNEKPDPRPKRTWPEG